MIAWQSGIREYQNIGFISCLQEYHNTLCSTLTALGYNKKLLTLEELHQEMARLSSYGVITLLGPQAVMQLPPDSKFSFDEAIATGHTPGSSMYGEMYKESVKMLLPLYDRQGAFDVTLWRWQMYPIPKVCLEIRESSTKS